MSQKGFLVVFEGGDGCGKSTQIKMFKQYLEDKGYDFIFTREPGGTELGEQIREILLHSKQNMSSETEFLLFSASRSKLIQEVVKPALESGKIVVMDRYFYSSYTYQGYAGNLDLQDLQNITEFAIKGTTPDLAFLLDLSYEEAMSRKSKDDALKELDRMEQKGEAYHHKVREGYLKLAENDSTMYVVNAAQSIDKVYSDIVNKFENEYAKVNAEQDKTIGE